MEFIIFILIICIFLLFNNFFQLKKETTFIKSILQRYTEESAILKKELDDLKKLLQEKSITIDTLITPIEEIKPEEINLPTEVIVPIEEVQKTYFSPIEESNKEENADVIVGKSLEQDTFKKEDEPVSSYESLSKPVALPTKPVEDKVFKQSAFSVFIKKAEKQFAENWTGILGTAIMVLGIGYLSIYTALKVAPLFRVLILWLYAALLLGSFEFLKKKEKWNSTGLWLRSAGASLFLFGCFGASQIKGLSFITNPILGYTLVAIGIALNLFIGYIIKKQSFLSLHTVLSLLILCVIPEKLLITFMLAVITSTIGIILSYKEKWEYHLLTVIASFLLFDIWFNYNGHTLSKTDNIFAILGIVSVFASCLLMQYRSVYENTTFVKPAFFTHLINWVLFAIGLILHSTGSHFKTFILFFAAIICFFIALKARKKKIIWLYHLDGMVSFILCALSIILLNDWNIGIDIIACVLYTLTLVCLFVVFKEKEVLLHKIFLLLNHILGFGLLLFLIAILCNLLESYKITSSLFSYIALSIISLSIPIYTAIKKEYSSIDAFFGSSTLSLNGLLSIFFSALLLFICNEKISNTTFYYVVLVLALLYCVLRKQFETKVFEIGRLTFLILSITLGLILITIQEKSYLDFTFTAGLFAILIFNWTLKRCFSNEFVIRFLSIIAANATFLVLIYKYLAPYPILQIASLFVVALLNHEFLWISFKRKWLTTDNETILYFFYYIFIIIGNLLFIFKSFEFSTTKIGLLCLGITIVEGYALFAKRIQNKTNETLTGWGNFNILNSEFILFTCLLFAFTCLQIDYVTVFLSGLAFVTFTAYAAFTEFKNYKLYSFLFLIGWCALSIFLAVQNSDVLDKSTLYLTQAIGFIIAILYVHIFINDKKEKPNGLAISLPYFINLWLLLLFFIEIEFSYLPLVYMLLALSNYGIYISKKINLTVQFPIFIGAIAIVVSAIYSFDTLNNFTIQDWIVQLISVASAIVLSYLLSKKEHNIALNERFQITLNAWISIIMFSQLPHKWLPLYWSFIAILNLFLYHKKISTQKNTSIIYYLLANIHLGFLSFMFYETYYLPIYLSIFIALAAYVYLASSWLEDYKLKNSILIYPSTLSIGCFLYLTFDKGILTFFWILEALGLLILGIALKEKYFRYVSLSLVGICVVRLLFFDLSNSNFLIRALVLLGVGVILIIMNSLFKKYKDRFD